MARHLQTVAERFLLVLQGYLICLLDADDVSDDDVSDHDGGTFAWVF